MRVGDLLQAKGTAVATAGTADAISDVLGMLAQHDVGALVVSDDGHRILGIISERDIVRAVAARGPSVLDEKVADVMTANVRTCSPDTSIHELMTLMTERRIRHVPVVVDGVLAGIVSIGDAVKHRIGELESETQTMHEYIWHGR